MFVLAKRSIIIPSSEPGTPALALKKDCFAEVPKWAERSPYFQALVSDGKLIVTDHTDKSTQDAADKKLKPRRGKADEAPAAASGALVGVVKSATLGDSSVTYDTSALTAGTESWGDLNATTYGQMLANRAKLIGAAGSYVI